MLYTSLGLYLADNFVLRRLTRLLSFRSSSGVDVGGRSGGVDGKKGWVSKGHKRLTSKDRVLLKKMEGMFSGGVALSTSLSFFTFPAVLPFVPCLR